MERKMLALGLLQAASILVEVPSKLFAPKKNLIDQYGDFQVLNLK